MVVPLKLFNQKLVGLSIDDVQINDKTVTPEYGLAFSGKVVVIEYCRSQPTLSRLAAVWNDRNPPKTQADKQRFLENLWLVQAKYRARVGQSVVLCSEAKEVEARGGRSVVARTFYNVYQRKAFLQEPKKVR